MGNQVFIELTKDENLKKMNIDPLLVDSFKRVMVKIQEYFNAHEYSNEIDFNEIVQKYIIPQESIDRQSVRTSAEYISALNSTKEAYADLEKIFGANMLPINEEDFLSDYIQKNYNVGLSITYASNNSLFDNFGQYDKSSNRIIINKDSDVVSSGKLDSVICHEFIHCLTMCGSKEMGSISDEMPSAMYEPLTEMLTSEVVGNDGPTSYKSFCRIIKYLNKIAGIDDYGSFLCRRLDSRYNTFALVIDKIENAFNKDGFDRERKYGHISENDTIDILMSITSKLINKHFNNFDDLIDNLIYIYSLRGDLSIDNIKKSQELIIKSYLSEFNISDEQTVQKIMKLLEVRNTQRLLNGRNFATIDVNGENYFVDRDGNIYYHDEEIINRLSTVSVLHSVKNGILLVDGGSKIESFDLSTINFKELGDSLKVKQNQLESELSLLIGGETLNRPYINPNVRLIVESRDKTIVSTSQAHKKKLQKPYIKKATRVLLDDKIKKFEIETEKEKLLNKKGQLEQIMADQILVANQKAVIDSLEEQEENDMSMGM